jgi:hypothetical protein
MQKSKIQSKFMQNMHTQKVFVLSPSQSKRLIAKGILQEPLFEHAVENGKIFIGRGSTNAYIVEELYKLKNIKEEFNKTEYMAGMVTSENYKCSWNVNKRKIAPELVFEKGNPRKIENRVEEIKKFGRNDIILKGANALDRNDIPAVLIRAPDGGTIGSLYPIIAVKGLKVMCPIGLEKQVNEDLIEISQLMGMDDVVDGAGMIPMPFAEPFTEIDALEVMFDCEVYHVASGGIFGAEGSISLLVCTEDPQELQKIDSFMQTILKEPNLM